MTTVSELEDRPMPEIPVLVVHGSNDPLFPPEHAYALAGRFLNAQLQIVDSAGHVLAWQATRTLTEAILHHTEIAGE
jgi:pimeloyl-ACP methyl ester carboxylesterase